VRGIDEPIRLCIAPSGAALLEARIFLVRDLVICENVAFMQPEQLRICSCSLKLEGLAELLFPCMRQSRGTGSA